MKRNSIKINAILNVVKSTLSIVFPFITYPYAVRVLGAENIGRVSYSQSIVSYFALVAMLGLASYSVREGAKVKNDAEKFQEFTNQIFSINVIATIISYILLAISLAFVEQLSSYRILIMILSLSIALTTFGIDWINAIFEDYFYITLRSVIANVISLVLLFVLVHEPNDYYIYAFLTITSYIVNCFGNWFYCRRYVKVRFTFCLDLKKHLKPILILFANAVTISIYVNIDTTMLGWIKGDYAVGLYTVAVKIYNVVKTVLSAIYAVSVPRLALYAGEKRMTEYRSLYSRMWSYLSLLIIPAGVGLICVSDEIMVFMGGVEYMEASLSLQILAVSIIFAIYGGLLTACLNVTLNREAISLQATAISAMINTILNLAFIPLLSYVGAAITTAISELLVMWYCLFKLKNKSEYMERKPIFCSILHAAIASVAMFGAGCLIKLFMPLSMYRLVITVSVCILTYSAVLIILRDSVFSEFIRMVKNKILDHRKV